MTQPTDLSPKDRRYLEYLYANGVSIIKYTTGLLGMPSPLPTKAERSLLDYLRAEGVDPLDVLYSLKRRSVDIDP